MNEKVIVMTNQTINKGNVKIDSLLQNARENHDVLQSELCEATGLTKKSYFGCKTWRIKSQYPYAVSFKEACTITRKYYRLHNNEPPDRIYAEILTYTVPAREGRSDKRNIKPKSTVWFVYRVA